MIYIHNAEATLMQFKNHRLSRLHGVTEIEEENQGYDASSRNQTSIPSTAWRIGTK